VCGLADPRAERSVGLIDPPRQGEHFRPTYHALAPEGLHCSDQFLPDASPGPNYARAIRHGSAIRRDTGPRCHYLNRCLTALTGAVNQTVRWPPRRDPGRTPISKF
jgi:hypothetical protein